MLLLRIFFFQAEDGIRDYKVTGVKTCALPIFTWRAGTFGCRCNYYPFFVAVPRHVTTIRGLLGDPQQGVPAPGEIGRASCRERVQISVVAVSLKKKNGDLWG